MSEVFPGEVGEKGDIFTFLFVNWGILSNEVNTFSQMLKK